MEQKCKFYIKAENFFNKGKYENAIRCCQKSLEVNPDNHMAYCILGLIAKQKGIIGDAFAYFKKSLEIKPEYIDGINNLGAIYNDNNMKEEAQDCFKKAIELYPNYPEANYNLANVLASNGNIQQSVGYYKKAIELRPDYYDSLVNIANILFEQGNLNEAENYYKRATDCKCDKSKDVAVLNYGYVLLYKWGVSRWREFISANISGFKKDSIYEAEARLCIEVANWVLGDVPVNIDSVKRTYTISNKNPHYLNNRDIRAYCNMLKNLDAFYKEHQWKDGNAENILYLVGDSHTLTCSNKVININNAGYKCKTELIRGCKIWHLINDKDNKMKVAYKRIMNSIPSASNIVMSFGEIDCRTNEGVYYRYLKYGNDLHEETDKLLDAYFLKVIVPLKGMNHNIYIWGIPAPHEELVISELHHSRREEYVAFINYFNEKLRISANEAEVRYVDNYSITNNKNGMSNYDTHIDFAHLKPEIYSKAIIKSGCNNATQSFGIYNNCNL
ncbi:MAG: tetratricopeptide repeat protein [Rickettsiales bacterium]|nr:tetratricopeptide repeat protein [Pseudomonadota bacterium]MDA0965873.1 tetratricopeptide repeat protein [Pseudomonadota bacterium]MDG4542657.1 tetratricopeptide repeat protein [Rickettsiales bacterium]MDG4545161.1 tetratricopeptide repeat protein [Rickettsiales bacterium]MDG4547284.1 tetratricopeptide repeat protein [Rickettsiales bacterium]